MKADTLLIVLFTSYLISFIIGIEKMYKISLKCDKILHDINCINIGLWRPTHKYKKGIRRFLKFRWFSFGYNGEYMCCDTLLDATLLLMQTLKLTTHFISKKKKSYSRTFVLPL